MTRGPWLQAPGDTGPLVQAPGDTGPLAAGLRCPPSSVTSAGRLHAARQPAWGGDGASVAMVTFIGDPARFFLVQIDAIITVMSFGL